MINKIIDIIHSATNVDLTGYTYTGVYSSNASTIVINGSSVTVPVGIIIPIDIVSIGSGSTVFCLGTKNTNLSIPQMING
jgi:hypothetical protein